MTSVRRHAHERLRHEARERVHLAPDLTTDLSVRGQPVRGELRAVEVEVELELARRVLMVTLDHVQAHRFAVLHHLVDDRLQLRELVDVVAVRLGLAFHRRRSVGIRLEPHHLGLGTGPKVQAGLRGEVVVYPLQVPAAVGGEVCTAVDLFLSPPEERAEHPGRLAIPRQYTERLDVSKTDQLAGLRAVADVVPVPVDEQVRGGAVDELEPLTGDVLPMLGRDALAHDPTRDGDELVVHVGDALGVDLLANLRDGLFPSRLIDERLEVGHSASPFVSGATALASPDAPRGCASGRATSYAPTLGAFQPNPPHQMYPDESRRRPPTAYALPRR